MSEQTVAPQECKEKHAITVEIDVIGSLLKLTNEELKAVIDGDFTQGESIQAHGSAYVSTSRTTEVRRGQALG